MLRKSQKEIKTEHETAFALISTMNETDSKLVVAGEKRNRTTLIRISFHSSLDCCLLDNAMSLPFTAFKVKLKKKTSAAANGIDALKRMMKSLKRRSDYLRVEVTATGKEASSSFLWLIEDALLTSKAFVVSQPKKQTKFKSSSNFCRHSCVKLLRSLLFVSIYLKFFFVFLFLLVDFLMSAWRL